MAKVVQRWPASMEGSQNVLWRCVAIAQTLLWFFGLPLLCKPYWESFWGHPLLSHPLTKQVLLNWMGFLYFATACMLMVPIYSLNLPFFEQYRITDASNYGGKTDDFDFRSERKEVRSRFWELTRKSVFLYLFNYGILVPVLTVGKYFVLGDNMSFSTEDWPTYEELAVQNIALTLIHEFGFYWSHRLAHIPSLYRFHKVHHEYKQNTIMASMHEHPIDYIITIAGPALLSVVIVQPHSFTLFQWIAWVIVANIDDHCGYEFPWSPVRWFYMAGGTDMHEYHHSGNMGCYASKLALYDVAFDSKRHWQNWRERRLKTPSLSKG